VKDKVLETGASLTQDFAPLKSVCAHLNAFHVYVPEDGGLGEEWRRERGVEERKRRAVESEHYCMHLSADVSVVLFLLVPF
jgi:hypothetical protein